MVTELHDLLAAAKLPGPYVLVGHSLGGALNVLYAQTYPDEVGALVIVDSPLPPERGLITPQQREQVAVLAIPPDAVSGSSSSLTTSACCSTRSKRRHRSQTSRSS